MWTGTPVKANTLDRAGGGQTSAPDFCIFASPLVLLPVFCEEHIRANTPVKTNTPNGAGGGLLSAPDFCIFALSPALQSGDFLRRTHVGSHARKKANTSDSAGGCYPHASDFRIAMLSRRPGGFLRAVRVRQPDLEGGGHFRRDGLSPGSSPSGRGGGILLKRLQSGGISV